MFKFFACVVICSAHFKCYSVVDGSKFCTSTTFVQHIIRVNDNDASSPLQDPEIIWEFPWSTEPRIDFCIFCIKELFFEDINLGPEV